MDLLLWRHAEAEDGEDDAARRLTRKGVKQAARVAAWLHKRLPGETRIVVSPAQRAQETAAALSHPSETVDAVNTGAQPTAVLQAAHWPHGDGTVLVVGHQPTLGAAAALALTGKAAPWRVRKGAVWWISTEPGGKPYVVAVIAPDLT